MNFLLSLSRLLSLDEIGQEVNKILKEWVGPLGVAIGGIGAIYIIILAVQYAKSENDSKRAEAKTRMINCGIGVIVLVILGGICLAVDWAKMVEIFGYAGKDAVLHWNI